MLSQKNGVKISKYNEIWGNELGCYYVLIFKFLVEVCTVIYKTYTDKKLY